MTARVSIHDVARAVGVSTTTVSNALTGGGRLSEATRTRVRLAAEELGYSAHPSARGLRTRRTGAIGLYLPDHTFGLEYYMHLAMGAAQEAVDHQLAMTLVPPGSRQRPHVDGVVVADPALGDPMLAHLAELEVPTVTCERDLADSGDHVGRVESDHVSATRQLLDHLSASGARTIALICPTAETAFGHDIRVAYLDWCDASGSEPLVHDVPLATEPEDVRRAVQLALTAPVPADAIVSVPDGGAASALQAVLQEGRSVPDDLLVASYVDSPSLRGMTIPITAVDISPREMGRRAVELLARFLEGESPRGVVEVLPTELITRNSTRPRRPSGSPRQALS